MQPMVSVIIPVYGVEKYIKKCLESVLNQTFLDFECIIINDGTLDNSIQIAKETVGHDPRFIFLKKENGGLASARNYGLDHAKGEYISFIDSDDYVEPDFIKLPLEKILQENLDICTFSINCVDEEYRILRITENYVDRYYNEKDYLISKNTITQYSWSKMYKKSIFNEIRFNENIITHEDVYVNFRILYKRKISNIQKPLYNYLQRLGTLSRDIKPTYLRDRIAIAEIQSQFVRENNLVTKDKNYIIFTYLKTFIFYSSVKFSRYSKNYSTDIKKFKKEIDYKKYNIRNIFFMIKQEPKVGISLLLFKISPFFFRILARFWFRNYTA